MDSYDLLIVNGLVVTSADTGHYDIAIKDEKIALLAPTGGLAGINAKRTLDAEGGYVMVGSFTSIPGIIYRVDTKPTSHSLVV